MQFRVLYHNQAADAAGMVRAAARNKVRLHASSLLLGSIDGRESDKESVGSS